MQLNFKSIVELDHYALLVRMINLLDNRSFLYSFFHAESFFDFFFLALYFNRPHCWFKFCFSLFLHYLSTCLNEKWALAYYSWNNNNYSEALCDFFYWQVFLYLMGSVFFFPSPRLPNPLPVVQDKSIFYFIKEIKQSKQAREISQEASLISTGRMIVNTYCWLFEEMAVSFFLWEYEIPIRILRFRLKSDDSLFSDPDLCTALGQIGSHFLQRVGLLFFVESS